MGFETYVGKNYSKVALFGSNSRTLVDFRRLRTSVFGGRGIFSAEVTLAAPGGHGGIAQLAYPLLNGQVLGGGGLRPLGPLLLCQSDFDFLASLQFRGQSRPSSAPPSSAGADHACGLRRIPGAALALRSFRL